MFELNGSDTDWLVYADYLEDQGIDAAHIREGVADPQPNQWHHEHTTYDDFIREESELVGDITPFFMLTYNMTEIGGIHNVGVSVGNLRLRFSHLIRIGGRGFPGVGVR
jgi:uncharacterized protein (TIGR02996 family)